MAAGLAGALVLVGGEARAARGGVGPGLSAPITGSVGDAFGGVAGQLAGTVTVESFAAQGGQLVANVRMTARLSDLAGNLTGTVTNLPLMLPASVTHAACAILELELEPLRVNVQGVEIDLSRVVLSVTAAGTGGRLGHLLCTFADVHGGGGPPAGEAGLLNEVAALFAG
ncbi:hypothetical protein [Polyangium spumosum]|uniref:Uncharacterized protein n=1 Tax=Polyangium spumosum TaxID=889282 RepID=A0A6N7PE90_9BACT|nr:hypothetical protein [Polyangium spumosum]MRG90373.1 hypothetical protein [Polyangium spumosum]